MPTVKRIKPRVAPSKEDFNTRDPKSSSLTKPDAAPAIRANPRALPRESPGNTLLGIV